VLLDGVATLSGAGFDKVFFMPVHCMKRLLRKASAKENAPR
jgi:hypothetical protein